MATVIPDEVVERLAELAHDSWAGWADWMFLKWDETHASTETFRDRWKRQIRTPYAALSEDEKASDRIEARNWIRAVLEMMEPWVEWEWRTLDKEPVGC